MKRDFKALLAGSLLAVALAGCSGASSSGGHGTLSVEQVIAGWPDGLGSLDLTPNANTFVTSVRKADKDATDVQVRSLAGRGGLLEKVLGATTVGADSTPALPDVVFVETDRGLPGSTDSVTLHRTVLAGALDPLGVASYASPRLDFILDKAPFAGARGVHGGHFSYTENVRLAGFAAARIEATGATIKRGTWCAFVAHGVGVVVLGSTLTQAQDEQLAADLQK